MMTNTKTKAEDRAEAKERSKRMDRYDAHMNQHGHYSNKKRPLAPRSAILDEILLSGQTLVSDYAERMGMPEMSNRPIKNVQQEMSNRPTDQQILLDKPTVREPGYWREYRLKRAAAGEEQ